LRQIECVWQAFTFGWKYSLISAALRKNGHFDPANRSEFLTKNGFKALTVRFDFLKVCYESRNPKLTRPVGVTRTLRHFDWALILLGEKRKGGLIVSAQKILWQSGRTCFCMQNFNCWACAA
jgi:hypothetical protein